MAINAFRNSTHFGMAMPVKLLPLGNDDIEKCKLRLSFDRQGHDAVWRDDLRHSLSDLWYFDFVHLLNKEAVVRTVDERFRVEVIMFGHYPADEAQDVFEGRGLLQHYLQLLEFLGF